jgi:hypothetical protein
LTGIGLTWPRIARSLFASGLFVFGEGFDFWREQATVFQQPAEIFFARVAMFAFAGVEVLEDLISHFQPLEMNDADEFIAMFPDLALSEFQRHAIWGVVSPDWNPERRSNYFFLPAACLLATAAFLLAAVLLAFDCFWPDFFWFALGDLSPMMFNFLFCG